MAVKIRGCATYETEPFSREELMGLPRRIRIPEENSEIHNFPTAGQASRFTIAHRNDPVHAEIYVHGEANDLMVRLFHDSTHQRGVTMGYLVQTQER